jgi:molecular chaperone GrpE (heat shock protein)
MAIFSERIISAKFIDLPNNMIIELLYQEEDKVIPYILEVDFTSNDFNDLLQELTLEEIEKNTQAALKVESDVFEKMINDEIDRRWAAEQSKIQKAYEDIDSYAEKRYRDLDQYAEQEKLKKFEEVQEEFSELRKKLQDKFVTAGPKSSEINAKDLLSIIDSKDRDDDFVFNAKIAILEDPIIGKSKDKQLKLSVRKSKSLWELFKIYISARE